MDRLQQKVGGRHEIGVEDRHKFARRGFEALLQRAGLEAFPVRAMQIFDGKSQRPITLHQRFGVGMGVVGRIVEHLDLQKVLGILDLGDFVDQPLDHVALVVNRQLDGDRRQLIEMPMGRRRGVFAVLEIRADDVVTV